MDGGRVQQSNEERGAEKLMDGYLKSVGLYRKKIAKDGSCLFRAVAEQVLHCQSLHTKVRARCVEYLRQHRGNYEAFIEGDFEDYLDKLQDPQQWVGEVEINALATIYKRDFEIFQDPGKPAVNITDNNFKDKVRLCFLNGNHYDSVYPVGHLKSAALCQSILYELLYDGVFRVDRGSLGMCQRVARPHDLLSDDSMPACGSSDESDLDSGEPLWVENGAAAPRHSRGRGRGRQLSERVRRSLNPTLFRNIEYDVWHKNKRAQQKLDYCIAAGMQFTVGDRCQVRLEGSGRSHNATIKEVPPNNGPVTVYIEELGRKQVPLWSLRPPCDENSWSTVVNRDKRLSNGHGGEWEERGKGRGRGKHVPASSSVSQATAPGSSGRVQKQHSWPPQAPAEEQGGPKTSRKSVSSVDAALSLLEAQRLAKEEEELNLALVEIQLRDEQSFPALGSQPGTQGDGGWKKGGEKKRSQRKTKSPVEDVRAPSPAGDRPRSSTPPPSSSAATTATPAAPSDPAPPAAANSGPARPGSIAAPTPTRAAPAAKTNAPSYASAAGTTPGSPPVPGGAVPPSVPSSASLFSLLPPALPSASSPPTSHALSSSSPPASSSSSRLLASSSSSPPPSSLPPPMFIAPIAPSPAAAQGFLPRSSPPVSSLPRSPTPPSSSSLTHHAAQVLDAPPAQTPSSLPNIRGALTAPQTPQTQTQASFSQSGIQTAPSLPSSQITMPQMQTEAQTSLPQTQIQTSLPQTQIQTSLPQTSLPQTQIQTSLPQTQIQTSLPQTQIQTSLPQTQIQTSLPQSQIQTSLPQTQIQTSLPQTQIQTSLPQTQIQTSLPQTQIQTSLPQTQIQTSLPQTSLPQTQIQTALPQTQIQTALPQTQIQTSLPQSQIQTSLPQTQIQTSLPQTQTSLPQTQTSLPQTQTSLPQTQIQTSLPQTQIQTSLPQTSLPQTQIQTSLPQTQIQTSLPQTQIQTSLPQTQIQTSLPQSQIQTSLPQTQIQTSLPQTQIQTSLPQTQIQTSLPQTQIQTSLPQTQIQTSLPQTSLPQTQIQTALPQTQIQTALPQTQIQTSLPQSQIQTSLPQTQIQTSLPQTQTSLPQTQTSLPQTQTSLPQTQIQTSIPQTQTQTSLPQTQTSLPQTQIQTSLPQTQTQTSLPQTQIQTSLPQSQPSVFHLQPQYPSQSEVVQPSLSAPAAPHPQTSPASLPASEQPPPSVTHPHLHVLQSQPPHPSQVPHPSLSLSTSPTHPSPHSQTLHPQSQAEAPLPPTQQPRPPPDSPPRAPSQHSHLPHPQSIPGAVPLQQLSQLYQDPLYPGFPQTEKGEVAPTPPMSSSRTGDDLPKDVDILRFFFNLGVKAYSMPMFPPYIYLLPLQQAHTMHPRLPSRSPSPAPHYPPPTRHQESYPHPQHPPTSASMPPQFDHQAPLAEPHNPSDPSFNQAGYPIAQPAPHRVSWQQHHMLPPRNPSCPVGYPAPSLPYPVAPPALPQGFHPGQVPGQPLFSQSVPPYPPSSMGYQSPSAPEELQVNKGAMEQQPANGDTMPGQGPGQVPGPPAGNNNRTMFPAYALKKEQGDRMVLLVDPPLDKPILVPNTGVKDVPVSMTTVRTSSPSPYDIISRTTAVSCHNNNPSRGYLGNPKPFHPTNTYVSLGAPPAPGQVSYLPTVAMAEPLSVACSTEDDWEEQAGFKPTTLNHRGSRRSYRGGGGRGARGGGHDPSRRGRRHGGEAGAGLSYVQYNPPHRGRGRERGY